MQVSTFLWFDGRAQEAAEHYIGILDHSRILDVDRTPGGQVTTVAFELAGQRCIAFDGGPRFAFTPAVSLYVECATQEELDRVWAALADGGTEGPGGSLTDRFGVSWQVLPSALADLLDGAGPAAAARVLDAVHGMTRIDIGALVEAHDG
ncbi:VOC family protein [Promicromonospora sp. NPDC060204]|uniref:VOC family protein n=1 Tax=Promicromonospora sp. NPDC060204 TaxID=3347071 RepID=UPI003651F81F